MNRECTRPTRSIVCGIQMTRGIYGLSLYYKLLPRGREFETRWNFAKNRAVIFFIIEQLITKVPIVSEIRFTCRDTLNLEFEFDGLTSNVSVEYRWQMSRPQPDQLKHQCHQLVGFSFPCLLHRLLSTPVQSRPKSL